MSKKLKLFIVLLGLFIFSGCTPEYHLEFKNNQVFEELKMPGVSEEQARSYFDTKFAIPKQQRKYIGSYLDNVASYRYTYTFNTFTKSNMVSSCYNAHNFFHSGGTYLFETGFQFNCMPYQVSDYEMLNYDALLVKIKISDYEVIKHNADEVKNGTYIWKITKDNYQNKSVSIQFKNIIKKKKEPEKKKKNYSLDFKILLIIIGSIIAIAVLVILYAMSLNKNRNKL